MGSLKPWPRTSADGEWVRRYSHDISKLWPSSNSTTKTPLAFSRRISVGSGMVFYSVFCLRGLIVGWRAGAHGQTQPEHPEEEKQDPADKKCNRIRQHGGDQGADAQTIV